MAHTTLGANHSAGGRRAPAAPGNRSLTGLGRTTTCAIPSEPNVEVRIAHRPEGVCVVACSGELDIAADRPFGAALDEVIRAGVRRLVLDLCRVRFIDSVAIGHILRAYQRLGELGQLEIWTANAHTRMLLQIAGLDQVTRMLRNSIQPALA